MIYDQMLPKCWTTIYMPEHVGTMGSQVEISSGHLELPFPVVRFIEPFHYAVETYAQSAHLVPEDSMREFFPNGMRGIEEMILWSNEPGNVSWATRATWSGCARPELFKARYGPEQSDEKEMQWAIVLQNFNMWTKDRAARFKRQAVSRQVRRYNGFSREYSEFVIMRKESTPRDEFKGGLSMRKLVPELMKAHPVRSHPRVEHLRTLRNGKIMVMPAVQVRAHIRGAGELVQTKDYKLV